MPRSAPKAINRARYWACRVKSNRPQPDNRRCLRRALDALYSMLPPCRDGHHPLDADNLKLEG